MILKNLWRRKTRTLLTILGIAIGVAAVLALSAFGEGMASGLESMMSPTKADFMVAQKDVMMAMLSVVDEEIGDEIAALPGVDAVAGSIIAMVQMTDAPYFLVAGEDSKGFLIPHYKLVTGEPLSGRRQIMLGKVAAKNFNKDVGSTFKINDATYRVVGIFETGVSFEDGGAVISLADAQRSFDRVHKVSFYNVRLKDPRRADEVRKIIETRWPDLSVTRSGEPSRQNEIFDLYRSFGLFLGLFAVLVGGLGMMNTTLMSVFERTREIGLLRAVGWRRRRIVVMIWGESLVLAVVGGVLGIGLGIGLTMLARLSPAVDTILRGVFTPMMFVEAFGIALLLGTIGGLYPAWRASQLTPVDAMRYDTGAGTVVGRVAQTLSRFGSAALRNLWRRPTRTLMTVIGVGIGIGFIVSMSAMTEGMISSFNVITSAGQVDLLAEEAHASDITFSKIDDRTAARIAIQPEVRSVSRLVFAAAAAPDMLYFLVFGIDPDEEWIKHYKIREGRLIDRPREIMLGRQAASSLKKGVGDSMLLGGSSYQIVGIYENGSSYEDGGGAIAIEEAQQKYGKPRQSTFLAIQVQDPSRSDEIARELEAEFPDVMISRASQATDRMQDFASTYAVLNALIVLTVIVGGIVMMNAMLMSVFERTQEIGVLRALGWRRRRVMRMVVIESLALSFLSALAGIGVGVAIGYAFTLIPGVGIMLTPAYSLPVFMQVIVLALILGALGGLYPAWRASNMQPIEALRYE
ncbi:MAG: FtsX-like permease family protein [Anaerolineae bacterium]